jgi:uncharacterized phage protein (TIGR02220 family)
MPIVKFTVSDEEMDLIRKWADGVPVGPLVRRLVMQAIKVPTEYLPGTSQVPPRYLVENPPEVPTGALTGTSQVPPKAGTDHALSPEKKGRKKKKQEVFVDTESPPTVEPYVAEIVAHLNETCGLRAVPSDPKIREAINAHRANGYEIDDFKAVHVWADRNWPDESDSNGKNWRTIMLVPSKLYGEKFGDWVSKARAMSKSNPFMDESDRLF